MTRSEGHPRVPPMLRRRSFLQAAGAAALSSAFGACATSSRTTPTNRPAPRAFTPVRVSRDRIIRLVAGLRPYRRAGFVVRGERLDDKTLIHNYGHGGGGITLSWGTAQLAVDEALVTEATDCAVIGCGAVGLATARLLQRQGRRVTIYARDLPPDTTSNIAGGQWSPFSVYQEDVADAAFLRQFRRAAELAYRAFQDLTTPNYGVRWVDNYFLDNQPMMLPSFFDNLRHLYPHVRSLTPDEHPFAATHVLRFSSMLIEPPIYLPAIMRDVLLAGGRIVVRDFHDPRELAALPEPVIVNCTGLGARALFGDLDLFPVKGQLTFLLPQSEVDYIVGGQGLYMMPRGDGILLGGTWEEDVWTLEPDPAEAERILEGHRRIFSWR